MHRKASSTSTASSYQRFLILLLFLDPLRLLASIYEMAKLFQIPAAALLLLIFTVTGASMVMGMEKRSAEELPGIRMPQHPYDVRNCDPSFASIADCDLMSSRGGEVFHQHMKIRKLAEVSATENLKMGMKHREAHHLQKAVSRREIFRQVLARDRSRTRNYIHPRHKKHSRPTDQSLQSGLSDVADADEQPLMHVAALKPSATASTSDGSPSVYEFEATVESGLSSGSGEYFMDVYIGTPRRHFSLIIDTGSDLNWVQCDPCERCYAQEGLKFDGNASTSYNPISCADARCRLVYSPANKTCDVAKPTCDYFYWYGDTSNTTGDLATETFTLNVKDGGMFEAENVIFGCGHVNEGLFRGAGGLLGLGRGPLSFARQLSEQYGRKFSYCLGSRDSNASSTLIFGEDEALMLATQAEMQYTGFANNSVTETFYYVNIEKVSIGGEDLPLPSTVWQMDSRGSGGTIVDSGTTLTYLMNPAYDALKHAFQSQTPYPSVESDLLDVCFNVTAITHLHFPSFRIHFVDGATWNIPTQNYVIHLNYTDATHIACLAIMASSSLSLSILGNFLQQNMHMLYDLQHSTLGFAPMQCSSL